MAAMLYNMTHKASNGSQNDGHIKWSSMLRWKHVWPKYYVNWHAYNESLFSNNISLYEYLWLTVKKGAICVWYWSY